MPANPRQFTQKDLRIAFTSLHQSLRVLQEVPPELLSLTSIPVVPYTTGERTAGFVTIDYALDLLEEELAALRVGLENHRARLHPADDLHGMWSV